MGELALDLDNVVVLMAITAIVVVSILLAFWLENVFVEIDSISAQQNPTFVNQDLQPLKTINVAPMPNVHLLISQASLGVTYLQHPLDALNVRQRQKYWIAPILLGQGVWMPPTNAVHVATMIIVAIRRQGAWKTMTLPKTDVSNALVMVIVQMMRRLIVQMITYVFNLWFPPICIW